MTSELPMTGLPVPRTAETGETITRDKPLGRMLAGLELLTLIMYLPWRLMNGREASGLQGSVERMVDECGRYVRTYNFWTKPMPEESRLYAVVCMGHCALSPGIVAVPKADYIEPGAVDLDQVFAVVGGEARAVLSVPVTWADEACSFFEQQNTSALRGITEQLRDCVEAEHQERMSRVIPQVLPELPTPR